MKSSIQSFLLLLIISTFSQNLYSQQIPDIDKLDRYFLALEENNRFMGSVFIMRDNDVLFSRAYGQAAADGSPSSPESIYRIGSITKSFTSTMILQLIEQEKLTLNTTLDQFFPAMPNAELITIELLLRHKSGLVNFTNIDEYLNYHTEHRSRDEHLKYFEKIGTSFEPGENTEYSNTAYVLLGFIIEDLTGKKYSEALKLMITEPLGLQSTYFGETINLSAGEVESFNYRGGVWELSDETEMSVPHAAGAIVSTAEETVRFYYALLNGQLLNEVSLEQMTTFDGPFGLGLIRFPFHDHTLIGHNGGIDGFQSNSAYDSENNLTFAVLGNGLNYNFNDILIGMLSITYGMDFEIPDLEERQSIVLTDEQLAAYTGTYSSSDFPLKIRFFVEGDHLMAQATGQSAFPLTIYDKQTMAFEQAGVRIVFDDKADGRYDAFDFTQAGMNFRFTLEQE